MPWCLLFRAFTRADIPSIKEPSGLLPGTSLRPDGATIIPWYQGRCLAWDVTCPDTLAASSLPSSFNTAGSAAEQAATKKSRKYQQLSSTHTFVPVTWETMGPINEEGLSFLNTLGSRIISKVGDPRERMFLFQRLSMAVQRGNVACLIGAQHQDLFFHEPASP